MKNKITQKELWMIEAIVSNECSENNNFLPSYKLSYNEIDAKYGCWSDTLDLNGAKHGEPVKQKGFGGVIASLVKKGYVIKYGASSLTKSTVTVTKEGWEAYQETMEKNS